MWNRFYIGMLPDFGQDWIIVISRNLEASLYRNDSTFPKKTIIQSGPKFWLHLYIEMIPHFLRKQCYHIKCVLFRQCKQYGINSTSVIDACLYIFKKTNNCWGVLQHNSPKHDLCLKDACIFIETLKWPTSTVKKTLTLVRFS